MYPLSITTKLLLAIKHCIFILWSHLRLRRHLVLPPLQLRRGAQVVLFECIVDCCYHVVDETEAFALTALLGNGETPGDFPVGEGRMLVGWLVGWLDGWEKRG